MEDAVYSRAAAKSVLPIAAASVLKPQLKPAKLQNVEVGACSVNRRHRRKVYQRVLKDGAAT